MTSPRRTALLLNVRRLLTARHAHVPDFSRTSTGGLRRLWRELTGRQQVVLRRRGTVASL